MILFYLFVYLFIYCPYSCYFEEMTQLGIFMLDSFTSFIWTPSSFDQIFYEIPVDNLEIVCVGCFLKFMCKQSKLFLSTDKQLNE